MSSMFCAKIYQCKNADWCARDFNPKTNGAPSCFEPMTNADKIRQMSDEELAKFIDSVSDSYYKEGYTKEWDNPIMSDYPAGVPNWLDWLKQEVSDED